MEVRPSEASEAPARLCLCWPAIMRDALRNPGFAWLECCAACSATETGEGEGEGKGAPWASSLCCDHPASARFSILATRRFGVHVLCASMSSRRGPREAGGEGGAGEEVEKAMAALRGELGEENVHDLRSLGPLHIPSDYEDDFNFSRHTLGRIASRCVSRARLVSVLSAAAAAHRTFREAVEESYRPGDLRRCSAVYMDQGRVLPFWPVPCGCGASPAAPAVAPAAASLS